MEYKIEKIAVKELEKFSKSILFLNAEVIPVSTNRINSYVNNPRVNNNDTVLYMAVLNNTIIAFRTVLPDILFIENRDVRFTWFSGSWVHSDFRRKGISTILMDEIINDWDNRILFTNYAPNSKLLYDKSNKFNQLLIKKGVRLYFSIQLTNLLARRNSFFSKIKTLLQVADWVFNIIVLPYKYIQKAKAKCWLRQVQLTDKFTEAHSVFLEANNNSLIKRGKCEYEWVFNYPWVTTTNNDKSYYPFSSTSEVFYYKFLTISDKNNKITALAIIKNRDGHVTVPYFEANKGFDKKLTQGIIGFCHKNRATMFTCYSQKCVKAISNFKLLAIGRKNMHQKYFISKVFMEKLKIKANEAYFYDGDSDCIFT